MVSRRAAVAGCVALAAIAVGGWTLWRASAVLHQSTDEVRRASQLAFTDRVLNPPSLPGVERIASAASFRDAAWFQDDLWIAGSSALFHGQNRYHVGGDLPAAPLVKLAVGVVGSAAGPQLLIATAGEGLVTYDGTRFRQIRPEKPEHRKLTALLPLETGQILWGTEKAGVLAWEGGALAPFHDSLTGLSVTALAGTLDDLWVGTMNRGLLRFHAGQLTHFPEAGERILSLFSLDGVTYAGMPEGVAEFRGGVFQRVRAEGAFASAVHLSQGKLVVGTLEQGILGDSSFPAAAVRQFHHAGDRLWAVAENGVYVREGRKGRWTPAIADETALLTDHNIAALAVEESGKAWIGYFDRGIDVLPAGGKPAHVEDEHLFCVNRIVPSKEGAVIATANGLVLAGPDGVPRRVLTRADGLIASHVTDIVVRPSGMVAATPAGITFLSPGRTESIYAFHGLVNNHVYCLGERDGQLVAGTLGGISMMEGKMVRASYTTANSALRHNWISALVDAGGEWYAGTYGAGVYRYDGAEWRPFPTLREPFEVNPNAMAVSPEAVYAGTLGRGVAVYSRSTGRWAFHTAGLPSLNVTALAVAGGQIWAGTDNGLVRIQERSVAQP